MGKAPTNTVENVEKEHQTPNEWEQENLRRVSDTIPWTIFLVAAVELTERITYRALAAPLQNYIENSPGDPQRPGALGKGQGVATGISFFYTGWSYLASIIGAIIADSWLGRYRTISLGNGFAFAGTLILVVTSLPVSLERDVGLPGMLVALVLIGFGSGCIKSSVAPIIAEQYTRKPPRVTVLGNGESVIVDPDVTIQTIFGRYFWIVNMGALSQLPASWLELKVAFWAAYLLPLGFWVFTSILLLVCRRRYVEQPPCGSVITKAAQVFWIGIKSGCNMDAAKPSMMTAPDKGDPASWDDAFVDELKRALVACQVFAVFPIFWLCYGQTSSNLVSQAARMNTHGVPSDMMGFFNPITAVVFIPITERYIFPALQRLNISFKPIHRISTGFVVMASAIGYTAGVQALIYQSPPCYNHPLVGACSDGGRIPNDVSVFYQPPVFILTSVTEVFSFLTGIEYAYTKAPRSMRSIVSSLFLLTCAIGSALGITLAPVSKDPDILIQYASLSGVMVATAGLFYFVFHRYDDQEEGMNKLTSADTMSNTSGQDIADSKNEREP